MKIGILTYHRAHNYGAVLQCYALQEVIKELGHDVEVIDYRQPFIEQFYKIYKFDMLCARLLHPHALKSYIQSEVPLRKTKKKNFEVFCNKYLTTSVSCASSSIPQDYDFYVIGSDQLWGKNCLGGKLDPIYFGAFERKKTSKVVGYAISTNEKSLNSVTADQLQGLIKNFNALSLREQSMADYVLNKIGVCAHVDLDPTLMLCKDHWNFSTKTDWKNRKYVVVYYVLREYGEYAHREILNKAKEIANKINAEVVDLSSVNYSVEDFVMSFKYAQCVVTSSFHASVFSVIFNTPLYSVKLHDGHDGRYVNLLKSLGMEGAIIELDDYVDRVPNTDYEIVERKMTELRKSSFDYLKSNLS